MRETLPEWALLPVAVALLLFGCFSFAAAWRYVHMGRRLAEAKMPRVSPALVLGVNALLALGTLVVLASILLR